MTNFPCTLQWMYIRCKSYGNMLSSTQCSLFCSVVICLGTIAAHAINTYCNRERIPAFNLLSSQNMYAKNIKQNSRYFFDHQQSLGSESSLQTRIHFVFFPSIILSYSLTFAQSHGKAFLFCLFYLIVKRRLKNFLWVIKTGSCLKCIRLMRVQHRLRCAVSQTRVIFFLAS